MLDESRITIALIAAMHLYWGVLLLFSAAPLKATPLSVFARHASPHALIGVALILVAVAALVALRLESGRRTLLWLAPQQMVLIGSAGAVLRATLTQQYADLTVVAGGWKHISTDQTPVIVLMLAHLAALRALHGFGQEEADA